MLTAPTASPSKKERGIEMFYMLFDFLQLILIILLSLMFFKLISILHKKEILKDIDIFFITSTSLEFKKYKNKFKKYNRGR